MLMCLLFVEDEQNLKVAPLIFISYADPSRIKRTGTRPDGSMHANLFMYVSDHNSICIYINGKYGAMCVGANTKTTTTTTHISFSSIHALMTLRNSWKFFFLRHKMRNKLNKLCFFSLGSFAPSSRYIQHISCLKNVSCCRHFWCWCHQHHCQVVSRTLMRLTEKEVSQLAHLSRTHEWCTERPVLHSRNQTHTPHYINYNFVLATFSPRRLIPMYVSTLFRVLVLILVLPCAIT